MKHLYLLFFGILLTFGSFAQTNTSTKLTGTYLGMSFERFVEKVESETPYKFFYKKSDVENIQVNLQASNSEIRFFYLALVYLLPAHVS